MMTLCRILRAAAAAWLGLMLASAAQAGLTFDYRVSTYFVTFTGADFAGANARYDVHVDVSGQPGDQSLGYTTSVRTGQSGFSWAAGSYTGTSDAYLALANLVSPGATGSASADLALVGGGRGAYDFGYDTPAAGLDSSFVQIGSADGRHALDFRGGGTGLLDAGQAFVLVVFLQGDWTGANAASLSVLGLNPAFSVIDNFSTYNPVLDATVFSASGLSDGGAGFGPDLRFRLLGDALPVPEPGTLPLMAAGLLALGRFSRRPTRAPR